MPTPLTSFIDRADLSNYLGRDVTTDEGAVLAVDAACDVCRTLAEQTFNQVTGDQVTLDGTGTDTLLLPERPVTNVGTVVVHGGTVTDYVLNNDGVLIRKRPDNAWSWSGGYSWGGYQPWGSYGLSTLAWPAGRQNIGVTYEHGYPEGEVPADLRMVALAVASRLIVQGVAAQESTGNVSVRYGLNATDLTNGERAILRRYKQAR